jgi:hypothetical protein
MTAPRAKVLPTRETLAGDSYEQGSTPTEQRATPHSVAAIEAPHDITASELFDVVTGALHRCGYATALGAVPATRAAILGLLATCVHVMRERGWTVLPPLPPGHHRPIDPR